MTAHKGHLPFNDPWMVQIHPQADFGCSPGAPRIQGSWIGQIFKNNNTFICTVWNLVKMKTEMKNLSNETIRERKICH